MPAETILLSSLPPLLQRPTFNIKRQLQLRVVVFVAKRSNCWCCWLCNTVTILCVCMRVLLFTFIAICWPDNKRDKRQLNVGILFIYLFTSLDLSQDFLMSLILWSGICSLMHGWGNTDEDYYIFLVFYIGNTWNIAYEYGISYFHSLHVVGFKPLLTVR